MSRFWTRSSGGSFFSSSTSRSSVSRSDSQCSCLSCCTATADERQLRHLQRRTATKVQDFYSFEETLGEGTFSVVYLAESRLCPGGWAAAKVIASAGKDLVDKEVSILSSLDHPHIVHLNEVFFEDEEEDSDSGSVCLILELAKGGEVFDRLLEQGAFSESAASVIIVQLLHAVDYLHQQGIVHRDLKLENLLYYDDTPGSKILVADFGLSDYLCDLDENSPVCGTPGYMAPELLSRSGPISFASDVWSIGVVTYMLLAGYPPFYAGPNDDEQELIKQIIAADYTFHPQSWSSVSEEAKDFVRKLLTVDPTKRPSCEEALDHAWLSKSQIRRSQTHIDWRLIVNSTSLITFSTILMLTYYYFICRIFSLQ